MKICYLSDATSIHTARWARHFVDRGHEVTVISFRPGQLERGKLIQLTGALSLSPWAILRQIPRVRRLVCNIAPDILHAHYVTSYGLAGALSGWRPFVVTAWGSDVLIAPEHSWLYRLVVRRVLARADLITSMAHHMTTTFIQRRYAPPSKIMTLPFGIDTEEFNPARRSAPHRAGPATVVSTRHLMEIYDVATFVRAIPAVLAQCPDTHFIIAGDGELRAALEQSVDRAGVRPSVEFRGKVPHDEVPHLLGEADVFVTTAITDGNNVSLNEAMACGAFPVASDIPANREWIEHGRNGLTFPVGDVDRLVEAVVRAIREPAWRQAAAAENWTIVNQHASWANNMARMEDRYTELAACAA